MRETGLPRTDRNRKLQGRRYSEKPGLRSLVFGLVLLGGFRQRLDEWWIGVELGAGASPSTQLAVLASVPLDALHLGDA
jgi:hypothetical protein